MRFFTIVSAFTALLAFTHIVGADVRVAAPPADSRASLYVGNRDPLQPSPLVRLPVGAIAPKGWLRQQLVLEADGMMGHLEELSRWCKFDGNAWTSPVGQGHSGWEELPYWLKGYGDLGYVLRDERIIGGARRWIDAILASQRPDGFFGPEGLRTGLRGKPDTWPLNPVLCAMRSYYEYSGDPRIIPFMARFFKWQNSLPPGDLRGGWGELRYCDFLDSVYWLYNRTGDAWLLDLAKKMHENGSANYTTSIPTWHNVNLTQGFREPAMYWQQARDPKFLAATDRVYDTVMGLYGQVPGGSFGGDENCRKGYYDPRQGFETCGIVEYMHSFELLTRITGNSLWADRCEEIAINSLPAALTPDLKALHYLTSPNQIQLDKGNKAPGVQNSGNMFAYSAFDVFRCCQHNHGMGWPYYAEELWLATADHGLCASLYSASDVTAKVGDGSEVSISEETDYPFSEQIKLTVTKLEKPSQFPLYLRVPRWCFGIYIQLGDSPRLLLGRDTDSYICIDREWRSGDVVQLTLPMSLKVRTWTKNNNAVSVDYGPLTFALKIGENWTQSGRNPNWPEQEVFPATPWNYGLILDARGPAASFEVVRKGGALAAQPFTPDTAPIELRAQARKIPAWKADSQNLVGKLQPSPVRSSEPVELVTLIPMGAARLRISAFPTIGSGSDAHEWTEPKAAMPASASHRNPGDTLDALSDGLLPAKSSDGEIPRFTWWDHRGTSEWVQYDFKQPRRLSGVEVYWFDDTGHGGCRVPQSWKLLYKDGETWKAVEDASEYGTKLDEFNRTAFKPVQASALRIEAQVKPNMSGGILEWRVID